MNFKLTSVHHSPFVNEFWGIAIVLVACLLLAASAANASGVVLQYHRISDSGPAITRTGPDDFAGHLALIERLGFPVRSLPDMLAGVCDSSDESSIAITFDDAHLTVYEQAWPLLRERGWPFVIFVNTGAVDDGHGGTMSWQQLRELVGAGVIIGNHGVDHRHMIRRPADVEVDEWQQWRRQQVIQAQQRIDEEVGPQPLIFAYPYGEYDLATAALMEELGYAAFGQQSGAFGCNSTMQALPRFPVSGPYANPESVELKLASLPFPTSGKMLEPVQPPGMLRPVLSLTLDVGKVEGFEPTAISCYATGQGAIEIQWDAENSTLTAHAGEPLPAGRSRYNCTARNGLEQRYHWFSQPWFIPDADGQWPAE